MIPQRIIQIWLGGPIPSEIARLIVTVIRLNPTWQHDLIGAEYLRAIGLSAEALREEYGSWAGVSNRVRLEALQRTGGFYLDCDFECLKPLDPLLAMGDCLAAEQDGGRICNAFMAATPNHPWIYWQKANLEQFGKKDAASGVYAATAAPREGLTLIPQHLVYPFMYDDAPKKRVPHPDSILVHQWDGNWA